MAGFLGLQPLFGAIRSLIPAQGALRETVDILDDSIGVYETLTATADGFYQSVIGSNLELQQQIRQSTIVLSSQLDVYDAAGKKIDDFTGRFDAIGPKIKTIQKEIELSTRDIVGATDTLTNSILNQTINQFSTLQGQTKEFANELEALPTLVAGLTSAFTTFQIPEYQVPQEIRSLLQGDINNPDSELAKQLQSVGLTKEAFEQARAMGEGLDFLNEKLSQFVQANASGADTIENSFSIIKDIYEQTFRSIGEDPTEGLRKGLTNVVEIINNPEVEERIKSIATSFGGPIGDAIEQTFQKVTTTLSEVVKFLDENFDLDEMARQWGKLFGDLVAISGDVATGVISAFGAIGIALTGVLKTIDMAVDGWTRLRQLIALGDLSANLDIKMDTEAAQKGLDDFQDSLDSKGPLRKFIDLVINMTPLAILSDRNNRAVEDAIEQANEIFAKDFERTAGYQEYLIDISTKIRDTDTSEIENFAVDLKADLGSQITALEDTIDFSELDEKATSQIKEVIGNITSATDFDAAQAKIQRIIRAQAVGGEEVLQLYQNKLSLVQQTIDDAIARRDELADLANNNDVTAKEREELTKLTVEIERQKELRREVSVALDPQIAKQQKVIDKLKEEGKSTDEAIEELDRLIDKRKEAGDPTEITGKRAVDLGASLTKVYSDLNTSIDAYREKIAKTTPQVAEDFERMSAALEMALKFGAATVEEAINLLNNAIADTTLPVEQRVAAQEQLVSLIEAELGLINSTLEIEQEKNNLLVQRGVIEAETATVLNNEVEQRKIAQQIAAAQEKLDANRLLTQTGAKEAIEDQLETLRKQLETAEEQEKVAINAQIAKKEELLNQTELSTQEQKELELEIESLQIQQESLRLQTNELKVEEALADITRKRQEAEQKINTTIAQRNLELAKARQDGSLKVDVEFQRQEGAIEDTRAKLLANEEEILSRVNALEKIREELAAEGVDLELSRAKQLELQNELVGLQTEGLNLQAQLIEQNLAREETILQNAINRQQQIVQLKNDTIDAEYGLEEAALKVAQSIQDSVDASRELEQSIMAVKETALSIEIAELRLRLSGIDKLDGLKEKLAGLTPNTEEFDAVQKAIDKTNEMYDISAQKRINLSKMFEKVNLSTVTQKELDNIQQAIDYNQELAKTKGDSLEAQLNLIDEIAKKELEQSEMMMNNQLAAIDADAQAKKLSLEVSDLEIQKELEKLEIKRLQLQIEKDMIDAKVKSGEISEEDRAKIEANIDKQAQAYDKIETSLNNQKNTNQDIARNIDEIAKNNKQIAKDNAELEQRKIAIAGEEDKIQRYTSAAADEAGRFSSNAASGAQNTGAAANEANRLATNMRNAVISANSDYGQAGGRDTSTGSSVRLPSGTIQRTPGEISTYDPETGVQTVYDTGGNVTRTRRVSGDPSKIRKLGEGIRQPGSFNVGSGSGEMKRAVNSSWYNSDGSRTTLINGRPITTGKSVGGTLSSRMNQIGPSGRSAVQGMGRYGSLSANQINQLNREASKRFARNKSTDSTKKQSTPKTKVKPYKPAKSSKTGSTSFTKDAQFTDKPLTDAQIITNALEEIGRLSLMTQTPKVVSEINSLNKTITDILSSAQNDPQIKAAQNRLTTLLAMPSRSQEQNEEIAELLKFIDEATEAQKQAAEAEEVTATTLLEAINSGAFQAGAFTPETDTVILQNPETGEIVIGGTRLDEAQLDMLFEVQTTNSILKDIRYNTLPTNTKEALQSVTVSTDKDSGTTSKPLEGYTASGGKISEPQTDKYQYMSREEKTYSIMQELFPGDAAKMQYELAEKLLGVDDPSLRAGIVQQFNKDAQAPVQEYDKIVKMAEALEGVTNIWERQAIYQEFGYTSGDEARKDVNSLRSRGRPEEMPTFVDPIANYTDLSKLQEAEKIASKANDYGVIKAVLANVGQSNIEALRRKIEELLSTASQDSIVNPLLKGDEIKLFEKAVEKSYSRKDSNNNKVYDEGVALPGSYIHGITPPKDNAEYDLDFAGDNFLVKNPYTGEFQTATEVALAIKQRGATNTDVPVTRIQPKTPISPIQAQRALNYFERPQGVGALISDADRLEPFGVLTPSQSQYFSDLETVQGKFVNNDQKLRVLQRAVNTGGALEGINSQEQINLLKFRNELESAANRGPNAQLGVYQKYGFTSKQEGDAAIAGLAPLDEFVQLFKNQAARMPDLEALKNQVRATLQPIANGVDVIATTLSIPGFIETPPPSLGLSAPSIRSSGSAPRATNSVTPIPTPNEPTTKEGPNPKERILEAFEFLKSKTPTKSTNVVNNYYPDNFGTINSILREAGL